MDNPNNRPSVIVFNNLIRNPIREDNDSDEDEIEILFDSRPRTRANVIVNPTAGPIDANNEINERNNTVEPEQNNEVVEIESTQAGRNVDSENVSEIEPSPNVEPELPVEIEPIQPEPEPEAEPEPEPELEPENYEDYINRIRENYELHNETEQYSTMYTTLFTHFKTTLRANMFVEMNPDNFLDMFRDIFQDVLNRVLEEIEKKYPDKFSRIKVNLHGEGINVNLQFLPFSELTSELFLIELYRVLQSRRDVVMSRDINLSFTFLPKEPVKDKDKNVE